MCPQTDPSPKWPAPRQCYTPQLPPLGTEMRAPSSVCVCVCVPKKEVPTHTHTCRLCPIGCSSHRNLSRSGPPYFRRVIASRQGHCRLLTVVRSTRAQVLFGSYGAPHHEICTKRYPDQCRHYQVKVGQRCVALACESTIYRCRVLDLELQQDS